ncbi:MAG: redox-sensing transcriptional repressor Rex [Planctomycetes bacterium]|nr:redox-sensing transcriptional repressor Rex [Planctomycetota bacterium]
MRDTIPKATMSRISLYLHEVEQWQQQGHEKISSQQLAEILGLTATQVRKDLTHFGQFGRPGVGYHCGELIRQLRLILGTDRVRHVALVGCGNLGRALATYPRFEKRGFSIVAVFDNDPRKIGRKVGPHKVQDMSHLSAVCRQKDITLAILAVPAAAAQDVADRLVAAGVYGILNFAIVGLAAPSDVVVSTVALSMELEQLGLAVRLRHHGTRDA